MPAFRRQPKRDLRSGEKFLKTEPVARDDGGGYELSKPFDYEELLKTVVPAFNISHHKSKASPLRSECACRLCEFSIIVNQRMSFP